MNSASTPTCWSRERERDGAKAFGGQGKPGDEQLLLLKRELARVKMERDFFKRNGGVLCEAVEVRFRVIERRDAFPIRMMCRCLALSPSGVHGWRARPPSPCALDDDRLLGRIREMHADSDGVTGSSRIWGDLRHPAKDCSLNRVARLMRTDGLRVISRKRRWNSKASGARLGDVQTRLVRDFKGGAPNTKWATDTTYIPTGEN